ncbi:MAG: 5-formyltetrahydrofolate cyclo-ligase [Sphingobacteriaceae bacterium]
MVKKTALRKLFTQKRQQLAMAEYEMLNTQLLLAFQQMDFSTITGIHLYLPIISRKEPDTFLIRTWLQLAHPQIQRIFPKVNFADQRLTHFTDDEHLELVENGFGIPEPKAGSPGNIDQVNLILVPLLAFDLKGYRVGYGKGFYDRFLAGFSSSVQFVGLSFFDPVDEIEDTDCFDIPLHHCITPEKIWDF